MVVSRLNVYINIKAIIHFKVLCMVLPIMSEIEKLSIKHRLGVALVFHNHHLLVSPSTALAGVSLTPSSLKSPKNLKKSSEK